MSTQGFTYAKNKGENGGFTAVITVSAERYDQEISRAVKEYMPHVEVKGFRKGHVPENIIRTRFANALEGEAQEHLASEAWERFSEDEKVRVFGSPVLVNYEKKELMTFTFSYYPLSEVKLPELAKIKAERDAWTVDESVVAKGLELYKRDFGKPVEDNEKVIAAEDTVTCDITYLNEKFGKYNKKDIKLRASTVKDTFFFAKELIGMKKGDQKEVETVISGEKAKAKITVNRVEANIPLTFTDEEKDRLTKVTEFIKGKIEHAVTMKKESALIEDIDERIAEKVKIDIPKGYLDEYVKDLMERFREQNIERTGLRFEEYLAFMKKTEEELTKELTDEAVKAITRTIIRREIYDKNQNDIQVNQELGNNYAAQLYQREMQNGLSRRTKEEQQYIVRNITRAATEYAVSQATNEFLKKTVTVSDKKETPYEPTTADILYWG